MDPTGCALLMLDADHFKQVNDVHGHVVGDAVLIELARRLTSGLRPSDCLARWGGEEFAVLLQGVGSDEELDRLAERLRSTVARTPVVAEGVSVRLTISIGAARAGGELSSLDALVEAADRCLYVAKRRGRDRVSLVPDLVVSELPAHEPEAVQMARVLAVTAGLREGVDRGPRGAGGRAGDCNGRADGPGRRRDRALHFGGLAPRRRQGRDPGVDPRQARSAGRRRVGGHADPSGRRRGHRAPRSPRCASAVAAVRHHHERSTAAATRTAWREPRSRSRRASSPPPTRTRQ